MFVDQVELILSSGKGGQGCVSFRQEKFVLKGGPDGGDGGRGGDVFLEVDKNSHTLSNFRGTNHLKAKNGVGGMGRKKYGKKGESLTVKVPPGTQVIDADTDEVLFDLLEDGYNIKFLDGGKGGLGNWHFRSSTNQRPTYAQPGLPGITRRIRFELKLIADVGLVGFPNVGKSTLISILSNATPEVANYEFTTLTPKLGVVKVDEYTSFVMADIPGIIEGASDGKGLGLDFLKHIERTKFLLFMLDIANYRSLNEQYVKLKIELHKFSDVMKQRDFAIAITRMDSVLEEESSQKINDFLQELSLGKGGKNTYHFDEKFKTYIQPLDEFIEYDHQKPYFILAISSMNRLNIKQLVFALKDCVDRSNDEENRS